MNWADITAVVGAAAWLPHVLRFFQKPRVTAYVGGTVEVGFTFFGPILNPAAAFRTERRDAIIAGARLSVTHERGQTARFRAVQVTDVGPQSATSTGVTQAYARVQSVVVLALTPSVVPERKFQFRSEESLRGFDQLHAGFNAALRRLVAPGMPFPRDEFGRAPEVQTLLDAARQGFFWQTGRYTVRAEFDVPELSAPVTATFAFQLTDAHLVTLTANLTALEASLRQGADPLGASGLPPATYNWVHPLVTSEE
ncbi:MAG TPA: hypothetical protein VES65_11330 [Solirubrobacteraceae bacterium]|nr:hypothetical protein [Solirubrobacteraceae bacterium]